MATPAQEVATVLVGGDGTSDLARVLEERLPARVHHRPTVEDCLEMAADGERRVECLVIAPSNAAHDERLTAYLRNRRAFCSVVQYVTDSVDPWPAGSGERPYCPPTFRASSTDALVEHVDSLLAQRRRERILEALQRTTPVLHREETPEAIAERCVEVATNVLGWPYTTVFELGDGGTHFEIVATTDERRQRGAIPERIPFEESLSGIAYQRGQPVAFDEHLENALGDHEEIDFRDIGESEVLDDPGHPMKSGLIVPLGTYGTLGIVTPESGSLSVSDYQFVSILAENATAALERTEREQALERANERLEAFAAVLSHDLRNPLSVASGTVALLREEYEDDRLETVEGSLERMDDLIGDVLTLVRADLEAAEFEWVSVGMAAKAAWDTVDTNSATLEVDPGSPSVKVAPGPLRELLENVFANAVTHAGPAVAVSVEATDRGFAIEDDGPGVPAADRERIFEYGQSGDEDGTGLGLAIVREIVTAFEWRVEATDGSGGGLRLEFLTDVRSPGEPAQVDRGGDP